MKKFLVITFSVLSLIGIYFSINNADDQIFQGKLSIEKPLLGFENQSVKYNQNLDNQFKFNDKKDLKYKPPFDDGLPLDPPDIVFPCEVEMNENQYGDRIFVDQTDVFIENDIQGYDHFGYTVRSAGDFNNDGIDDVIIGDERFFYMFYGQPCGIKTVANPDLTFINPEERYQPGVERHIVTEGSYFKESASLGDFNGDNIDDIALSAYVYPNAGVGLDPNTEGRGVVYIYLGGHDYEDRFVTVDEADHAFYGEDFGNLAGQMLRGVGDVNNDGLNDLAIGAIGYNKIEGVFIDHGAVYLVFGSEKWKAQESLSEANVKIIRSDDQEQIFRVGEDISLGEDLNDDGINDFVIGSLGSDISK